MVGLLASRLIDALGWQSLFYIGGILPLGLSMVLIRALPDSIVFLVIRGAPWHDISDLLIRISPTVNIASGCQFFCGCLADSNYLAKIVHGPVRGPLWES